MIQTIRTACAHDCPDQCSLIATVEDGRLLKLQGDPEHPMTAGFACAKVNREHEMVHSPERVLTPLRRTGPKGEGHFAPVTWDEALAEIVERWTRVTAEDGPLALLGYAYSAHQGQLNRGLLLGLFHALGCTRLIAGTVCDSAAEAGWDAAAGSIGGSDPESVVESDLIISWGADLLTTNLHIWPLVEEARAKGAQLVVIEPRRSGTAARADWHLRVNVGSDAALALGMMHVLAREGLADQDYLARETLGFDRLAREVLPRFTPARVAEITGVSVADLERLAGMYGRARAPFIRLGEGMSRTLQGGQTIRAVALLPGVVGAYAKRGGGALLMTATGFGFDSSAIRKPSGPAATRTVNHSRLGEALLTLKDPPIRALFVFANNPAVTCPDLAAVRRGLSPRGSLHRGPRPLPLGYRALCRSGAARGHPLRERGRGARLRDLLHAVHSRGGAAARRGVVESPARPGAGAAPQRFCRRPLGATRRRSSAAAPPAISPAPAAGCRGCRPPCARRVPSA